MKTVEVRSASLEHEIAEVLAVNTGNKIFSEKLEQVATGHDLLRILGRYIHFNSVFSCGVAALAAKLGVRQDLFRDRSEPADSLVADRSAELGAQVFFAAIDEFGDRSLKQRGTHRSLAQATLCGVARFLGISTEELTSSRLLNEGTHQALAEVLDGYCLEGACEQRRLLSGIGFHIASEMLADEEFRLLDEFFRRRFPQMVDHLEGSHVAVNGFRLPGYHWIRIHTTVEVEHSNAAFKAADLALQYYAGPENHEQATAWILKGVKGFSELQGRFMNSL